MSDNVNISDILKSVNDKIKRMEPEVNPGVHMVPKYPLVFLLVGTDSEAAFLEIYEAVAELWPAFKDEVLYLGFDKNNNEWITTEYKKDPVSNTCKKRNADNLEEIVLGLSDETKHFPGHDNLFVFPIINTKSVSSTNEIKEYDQKIDELIDQMGYSRNRMVILTSIFSRQTKRYESLDREIRSNYGSKQLTLQEGIILFGNLTRGGIYLKNWNKLYRIVALIAALANGNDTTVTNSFLGSVNTVQYSREGKRTAKISEILVRKMIEYLNKFVDAKRIDKVSKGARKDVGFSENGTFYLYDQFIKNFCENGLPTNEELEFFPRKDMKNANSPLSFAKFNEDTMGAWGCYINKIYMEILNSVLEDIETGDWEKKYVDLLKQRLSVFEMVEIKEDFHRYKNLFYTNPRIMLNESLYSDTMNILCCKLSSEEKLMQYMEHILKKTCIEAEEFKDTWEGLNRDLSTVSYGNDGEKKDYIKDYYTRKITVYLDEKEDELNRNFSKIWNTQDLGKFLKTTLTDFISQEPVFRYSFDKELSEILRTVDSEDDPGRFIYENLLGKRDFMLKNEESLEKDENHTLSAVVMDTSAPVKSSLQQHLRDNYYQYFNTANGRSIEIISVYQIPKSSLFVGK